MASFIHSSLFRRMLVLGLAGMGGSALAAPPAKPYSPPAPQATVLSVEQAFVPDHRTPMPGAGVHSFDSPGSNDRGRERFEIRWMAAPPGIPPGTVVLLETVQARSARIRSRALRLPGYSSGLARSVIVIPSDEIDRAGRVRQWRVSVVWRGKVLARQVSANWKG